MASTSSGLGSTATSRRAPACAEVRAVDGRQHERLPRRPALEDAGELHQRGGVGRRAWHIRDHRGVARGHDHDLTAGAAGAAADDVHELVARVAEPLHDRTWTPAAAEPARGEGVGNERRGGAIAARAGAPSGCLGGDAVARGRRPDCRRRARPRRVPAAPAGPALEGEHRQDDRQKRRHERRAVYPRLYHVGATYAVRKHWAMPGAQVLESSVGQHRASCSSTTSCRSRSS